MLWVQSVTELALAIILSAKTCLCYLQLSSIGVWAMNYFRTSSCLQYRLKHICSSLANLLKTNLWFECIINYFYEYSQLYVDSRTFILTRDNYFYLLWVLGLALSIHPIPWKEWFTTSIYIALWFVNMHHLHNCKLCLI